SAIVGLYFSYLYNLPSGATIVLCAFLIYIVIFILSKLQIFNKKGQTI
ncbi:MAG: metal ABC transporter permease, partial [Staphylococcus equorum]|nr:metal ABC transporter permease [Staphylococcus equorum]